jgi:Cu2+-exporting ATPase
VDANSEHPVDKAITTSSAEKLAIESFKRIPGKGAEGKVAPAACAHFRTPHDCG